MNPGEFKISSEQEEPADIAVVEETPADIAVVPDAETPADIAVMTESKSEAATPDAASETAYDESQQAAADELAIAKQILLRGGDTKTMLTKLRGVADRVLDGSVSLSKADRAVLDSALSSASRYDRTLSNLQSKLKKIS